MTVKSNRMIDRWVLAAILEAKATTGETPTAEFVGETVAESFVEVNYARQSEDARKRALEDPPVGDGWRTYFTAVARDRLAAPEVLDRLAKVVTPPAAAQLQN